MPKGVGNMAYRHNRESLEMLEGFAERNFYGEVTLFFQNGGIESCRIIQRKNKKQIREHVEAQRGRHTIVIKPKDKGDDGSVS
jgi:hypothetical protein